MVGKEPYDWDDIRTEADVNGVKDVTAWDDRCRPLLFAACKNGCEESVVSMVISKGGKVDVTNKSEKTPLFAAVRKGNARLVKMLLEAGANPNHLSKAGLWLACRDGMTETVRLLVQANADTSFLEERSQTDSLIVALSEGHEQTALEVLAADNFQVKYEEALGCSPLWVAASAGLAEACTKLLAMGSDANQTNEFGRTPLMAAAIKGHAKIVENLLQNSADAGMVDENGENALYMAASTGQTEAVAALLAGAIVDVNETNNDGETPLISACWFGHQSIVKYLTEHGAKVDKQNKVGKTPLIAACWRRFPEIAKELLAHGADIHLVDDHGRTPLWAACRSGCPECVGVCLEAGADPEQKDQRLSTFEAGAGVVTCTPIFAACWEGHGAAVKKMLEKGCSPDDGDDEDRSPASVTENEEIKALLKEFQDRHAVGSDPAPPPGKGTWEKLTINKKKIKGLREQLDPLKREKESQLAQTAKTHAKLQLSQQELSVAKEGVANAANTGDGVKAAEEKMKKVEAIHDELKKTDENRVTKLEEVETKMAKISSEIVVVMKESDTIRGKSEDGKDIAKETSRMNTMMSRASRRSSVKEEAKVVLPNLAGFQE